MAYGAHLAETMEATFTSPFEVVTDNVIFGLDTFETGREEIPKYDNFLESDRAWNTAIVKLGERCVA